MQKDNLISCEKKVPLSAKIKQSYRENSMLCKFYAWIKKKTRKKKTNE